MKKLIIASQNKNKIAEIKDLMPKYIDLVSINDLNYNKTLEETGSTIKYNAIEKSKFVNKLTLIDCFSDDSGLEIQALGGEPGVYSARYSQIEPKYNSNIEKVLKKLEGISDRKALFRTVIALQLDGEQFIFEGILKGKISKKSLGDNGFGYDSIFIPQGHKKTLAQMDSKDKIKISHRTIAIKKMIFTLNEKIIDKSY